MPDKRLLRLEIAGPFITFTLASLLHFIYDLNPNVLTALFGAVNESIWEHIKIFSIAYLFYGFIELLWARPVLRRFLVAKTMGVISQGVLIPLVYYTYTAFSKKPVLIVDLIIGFTAASVGFFVSWRLYNGGSEIEKYFLTSIMILFLILMCLLCFTYFPPKAELFRDVITNEYGVKASVLDAGAFRLSGLKNTDLL